MARRPFLWYFCKDCDCFLSLSLKFARGQIEEFWINIIAEDISKQISIDCHIVTSNQSYSDLKWKEQTGREKYKMSNLKRKRAPASIILEPSLVLQVWSLKKGWIQNGIKGVVPWEWAPPSPVNPATCGWNRPEGFPQPRNHQQVKSYANVSQGGGQVLALANRI